MFGYVRYFKVEQIHFGLRILFHIGHTYRNLLRIENQNIYNIVQKLL